MNELERANVAFCRKKAIPTARALLLSGGNRTLLILSILICAVASLLPTVVISWPLTYLLDWEGMYYGNPVLYAVLYYLEWLVCLVFFFFTAAPVCFGLYRMAVRMSREEEAQLLDVFYYFSSRKLYGRAIKLVFWTACFVIPVYGAGALAVHAFQTENGVLLVLSLLLLGVVFLLSLLLFSLEGGYLTLSVIREDAPLGECRALAREVSRGKAWENVLFLLSLLWRLCLSLLSVGVVLLLHTLPVSLLASANYVGRLAEKVTDLNS